MQRRWQRALLPVAAGALVAGLLTGCPGAVRRPGEPRPGPGAAVMRDLNGEIARVAAREPGAGDTAAVVLGNVALVAINLNNPAAVPGPGPAAEARPGAPVTSPGTQTTPGRIASPSPGEPAGAVGLGSTSSPSPAGHAATPGGAPGQTVARPGGGNAPGPVVPGGSPTSTAGGGPAAASPPGFGGGNVTPTTSSLGTVHNAVAASIIQAFPFIAEVRFVTDPAAARRLAEIARQIGGGRSVSEFLPELAGMAQHAAPAAPLTRMPSGPPQSGATPPGTQTTSPTGYTTP